MSTADIQNARCPVCRKPYFYAGAMDLTAPPQTCQCYALPNYMYTYPPTKIATGWQCPRCAKIHAPSVKRCTCLEHA